MCRGDRAASISAESKTGYVILMTSYIQAQLGLVVCLLGVYCIISVSVVLVVDTRLRDALVEKR